MYQFRNTERTNSKASEFETKSLLYLIGFSKDKTDISLVSVDCFNDVTGINNSFTHLWDIQSKGEKNLTPRKMGEYLFTLYENFKSDYEFKEYILFAPTIKENYLVKGLKGEIKLTDFLDIQQDKVRLGLEDILNKKEISYNEKDIGVFLEKVKFIEDRSKKSTYIKRALVFNNTLEKEELFYESIFNEIRDLQTAKKNSYIENEYIEKISEVQKFNRHIYKKDLHMLIINRYVGVDLFNESMIPPAYVKEISELDEDDIEDHLLDCKSNISRAFFDKNSKYEFWAILESIIIEVKKKPKSNIRAILDRIPVSRMDRLQHLDSSSILLLIALIKSGLKNDNK